MLVAVSPAGAAVRRTPALAPTNTVIDGPNAGIEGLSGMVVTRDGTGGIIYLKRVGGVTHVFVSPLIGGSFHGAQELDAGLPGPSSQPVLAGTTGGQMVAAFINGGELYTAQDPDLSSGWGAPQAMYAGASNPSLSMSTFGKAYLAFTAPGAGGDDVRAAYFNRGVWSLIGAPLDANPSDDAGSGTGRPDVVACGDGIGIVVWGENGHIYSRRIRYTSPSVAVYQADPSMVGGWNEVSAEDPVIGADGDSSYAPVAFREILSSGGTEQTRVIFSRLHSDEYDYTRAIDGLGAPGQDADQPAVGPTEFGSGFVTAEQTQSHNLFATTLGTNDALQNTFQVNSLPESSAPYAVPASAGTVSTLIAWQQDQGNGSPEIRLRYAVDGSDLGPEQVLSSPSFGATNASEGLAAGGDLAGDVAVAWVQGSGSQTRIMAAQLFQSPGGFNPSPASGYSTAVHAVLHWSAASELWGPTTYVVKVNGVTVGQTTSTYFTVPSALSQGRHSWQVTAINPAGVGTAARPATVFVDSLPPRATLKITGERRVGARLSVVVKPTDLRPGVPRKDISGVRSVQVKWGDGSRVPLGRRSSHVYKRRGRFVLTVTVRDKAGNRLVITRKLKIAARGKASKPRGRKGHR